MKKIPKTSSPMVVGRQPHSLIGSTAISRQELSKRIPFLWSAAIAIHKNSPSVAAHFGREISRSCVLYDLVDQPSELFENRLCPSCGFAWEPQHTRVRLISFKKLIRERPSLRSKLDRQLSDPSLPRPLNIVLYRCGRCHQAIPFLGNSKPLPAVTRRSKAIEATIGPPTQLITNQEAPTIDPHLMAQPVSRRSSLPSASVGLSKGKKSLKSKATAAAVAASSRGPSTPSFSLDEFLKSL